MKKTLVIVGHPQLKEGSLANRIIVEALAEAGAEIRDLAALYPDFKIDVEAEQAALVAAERVIFQFPFYWYGVPGILKEWMDRVLAHGFAYGSKGKALHGKGLLISTTIGGPARAYQRDGYNTYTVDELMMPLKQTAKLCGMTFEGPVTSHGMIFIPGVYNTQEEVEAQARDHAARLITLL